VCGAWWVKPEAFPSPSPQMDHDLTSFPFVLLPIFTSINLKLNSEDDGPSDSRCVVAFQPINIFAPFNCHKEFIPSPPLKKRDRYQNDRYFSALIGFIKCESHLWEGGDCTAYQHFIGLLRGKGAPEHTTRFGNMLRGQRPRPPIR
jgi:hypothetical protein